VAQEHQNVWTAVNGESGRAAWFDFRRGGQRVVSWVPNLSSVQVGRVGYQSTVL